MYEAPAIKSNTLGLELGPIGIRVFTLFIGEVSTPLMSSDNISFGAESLCADIKHKVKEWSAHHAKKSMAPDVFAEQVVFQVLGNTDTDYIWKGTNALLVWLLNAIVPRKVFDSTMKSSVGFDDKSLVQKIYQRGQQGAGRS